MAQRKIIVAGVSSAGKSTFIERMLEDQSSHETEVFFAGRLVRAFGLTGIAPRSLNLGAKPVAIVHYNTQSSWISTAEHLPPVEEDPLVQALRSHAAAYELYLCYAPDAVIRERMARRTAVEPVLGETDYAYPNTRLCAEFDRIDQRERLLAFAKAFHSHCPQPTVVFSNARKTSLLSWEAFRHGNPTPELESALM